MKTYEVKVCLETFGSFIDDIVLEVDAYDEEDAEKKAIEEVRDNLLIYADYVEEKEN